MARGAAWVAEARKRFFLKKEAKTFASLVTKFGWEGDLPVRPGLYRRIDALENDRDDDAMAAELIDRFGPMPGEMENAPQIVS
jgi:hypothetical protein